VSSYFKLSIKPQKVAGDFLWAQTLCHPIIIREVLDLTPTGTALKLMARFTKTNTVINLAAKGKGLEFKHALQSIELKYWRYIVTRFSQDIEPLPDWKCVTLYANKLRSETWDRDDMVLLIQLFSNS
jgi:hypothetical protein